MRVAVMAAGALGGYFGGRLAEIGHEVHFIARGANLAMMMEILAAGVTGGNWSMDAPHYAKGSESPGVGLFLVAVKADVFAADFAARLAAQIDRLGSAGGRIPGSHITVREIDVADDVMNNVRSFGTRT